MAKDSISCFCSISLSDHLKTSATLQSHCQHRVHLIQFISRAFADLSPGFWWEEPWHRKGLEGKTKEVKGKKLVRGRNRIPYKHLFFPVAALDDKCDQCVRNSMVPVIMSITANLCRHWNRGPVSLSRSPWFWSWRFRFLNEFADGACTRCCVKLFQTFTDRC